MLLNIMLSSNMALEVKCNIRIHLWDHQGLLHLLAGGSDASQISSYIGKTLMCHQTTNVASAWAHSSSGRGVTLHSDAFRPFVC